MQDFLLTRVLLVPKTNAFHAVVFGLLLVLILAAEITLSILFLPYAWQKGICIPAVALMTLECYLRFYGIVLVRCYQHYAKEKTRRKCLCVPSCSDYAVLCLKRYGLVKALVKIRKRLFVTCRGKEFKIDAP